VIAMGLFSETKPTLLAGYIITIVAFAIHLIGFATPYWYSETVILTNVESHTHLGLWTSCSSSTVGTTVSPLECGRYVVEVNANVSISKLAHTTLF